MRIRWTTSAVDDLTAICDYLAERENPALARTVALAVYRSVKSLAPMPRKGRQGRLSGTRELIITRYPYIVIYELHSEMIFILRVLHTSQQWPKL